jgi:hypothetical protein
MVSGISTLPTDTELRLSVSYDAATHTTIIYLEGKEDASGTQNQNEPYMLAEIAADTRNYIGRTQWWDGSYANENQDFVGTISTLRLYDVCLTQEEICSLQGIAYEQKELPEALINGDFEGSYAPMLGSGVTSDRAIYLPEGWQIDYANRNENDLTALKSGDLFFDRFFAALPSPSEDSKQTYWIRQNWGEPTLTLKQQLRLPAGQYTLKADVWKSGLGGDLSVTAQTEGGATVRAPKVDNKEEWQQVSLLLDSDGKAATTILLTAMHNSSGSEKIIGFDNVCLELYVPASIQEVPASAGHGQHVVNDLQGRRVASPGKGIYIIDGKKVIK